MSTKHLYKIMMTLFAYISHWGRVTHICVSKLTTIGSDTGLSPGWCQAIIWTNDEILVIGPLGTNFSEILIEIYIFSFKKMHFKISAAKWHLFLLGLNVLKVSQGWEDWKISQIAKFMGPTWDPPGSSRPQMGPMLAPWTLLSEMLYRTSDSSKALYYQLSLEANNPCDNNCREKTTTMTYHYPCNDSFAPKSTVVFYVLVTHLCSTQVLLDIHDTFV